MIANLLTSARLLLTLPVAWACAKPDAFPSYLLILLLVVAIATDYFDGKVARHMKTASANGMLFDHATDFIFVTSALFAASYSGLVIAWLPILIVFAFSQYVLDSYWLLRQKQLRMSMLGRWNGVLYFAPLVLIGLLQLELLNNWSALLRSSIMLLSIVLLLSTLASIVDRAIAPLRTR